MKKNQEQEYESLSFVLLKLGTLVLDTHNPDHLIAIPTVGNFNLRINAFSRHFSNHFPDQSTLRPLTGYDYHAGY